MSPPTSPPPWMPWQNWEGEMIENLSPELAITIGAAALALVAVAWVLVRWGKAIVRLLLLLAGLAVVGLAALAMTRQATATLEVARVAEVAAVGQTVSSAGTFLVLGALVVVVILALLAVGYFWLRWKLAEARASGRLQPTISRSHRRRQQLPQPVVYVLEQDLDDLIPVPSGEWAGNWEDDGWMDDGLSF